MPFILNDKSFIFCDTNKGGDGLVQHFNAFCYYGQYLRGIVASLFVDHNLVIPMWDMSIGYGQDIVSTLSYYVIGDPFSFLSIIVPTKYAEYAYSALILARFYCAGLTFSMYCRYRGMNTYYVLVGSFIYIFCHYALTAGVLHPYFLLPMIWLPLLFMGIDKILKNEGFLPYVLSFAIAGISNFYFFYMLCIIIFIYSIFRYFELYPKNGFRHFCSSALRIIAFSVLGAGIAAVLLIPSLLNILGTSRVNVENNVPALYNLNHYLQTIPAFVIGGFGQYCHLGFSGIGFLGVLVLFMRSKEHREYRFLAAGFLLLLVFFSIPFFGHLFNGFSYVTNRWVWALSFLVGYIVVVTLPLIRDLSLKEKKTIIVVAIIFALFILSSEEIRNEKYIFAIAEVFIAISVLFYCGSNKRESVFVFSSLVLIMGFIGVQAFYFYSPDEGDYIKCHTESGEALNLFIEQSPAYILNSVDDDSIYRFDTAHIDTGQAKRNSSMLLDKNGIAFYFSTTNPTITDYILDMKLNYSMDYSYKDLDRRCVLQTLAGVKYCIIPDGSESYLPYGYSEKVLSENGFTAYRNPNALPIGFTSDKYINADEFNSLDAVSKENALLKGVVIEEDVNLDAASVASDGQWNNLVWESDCEDGIEFDGNKIIVENTDSKMTMSFKGTKDEDLYLIIDKMSFAGENPYSEVENDSESEKTSFVKRLKRSLKRINWKEPTSVSIAATSGQVSTSIDYRTPRDNYYCAHDSFVANLGYSETERNTIVLSFNQPGTYSFDSLQVVSVPRDNVIEDVKALTANTLSNTELVPNGMTGDITLDEAKLLCVQIPYSAGWSAYVDGESTPIMRADGMFMALYLDKGHHDIEFKYRSPYLFESLAVSLVCCVVLVLCCVVSRKVHRSGQGRNGKPAGRHSSGDGQ